MFKVTKTAENRLDIEMSGKLDSEQMKVGLDDLLRASQGIEHGQMLYDVVDFHLPSIGAIGVEFSRLPAMFGLIKKFNKAAVLTDKNWLKKVSELEGALYPNLEIKGFGRDQREQAEAWLSS